MNKDCKEGYKAGNCIFCSLKRPTYLKPPKTLFHSTLKKNCIMEEILLFLKSVFLLECLKIPYQELKYKLLLAVSRHCLNEFGMFKSRFLSGVNFLKDFKSRIYIVHRASKLKSIQYDLSVVLRYL